MACKSCGHKPHSGPCFPNCRECAGEEPDNADGADAVAQSAPRRQVRRDKVGGSAPKVAQKAAKKSGALSQVERNQRWRERNRERYNEYMRRYRKKRSK